MKMIAQSIAEVILIQPKVFADERGYFLETYREDLLFSHLHTPTRFVQANESSSTYGVVRGLHFQIPPFAQAKLVRVVQGEILDVAVDIRPNSPTYRQYVCARISQTNKYELFVPEGFAHGFSVLSETAVVQYMVSHYYSAKHCRGIYFADPDLGIDWLVSPTDRVLSDQDKRWPSLAQAPPWPESDGAK